ncbi:chromosome partitioning ATPase [Aquabacterium lacunae]|uniref:non-specific protein-tyrosine kinase n=1 Tax=Aquabacterium lacunae TaxID=2528630 RepID=A0A4Q9H1A9_9BURK|nr:XrtA-associated tyrosine autokinase [Aquabacterium lacunae]TBO30249.1 chromosome partitioning ATPase [Aquabacterium lacunae]
MTNSIEQAALRLAQLRQAGAQMPDDLPPLPGPSAPGLPVPAERATVPSPDMPSEKKARQPLGQPVSRSIEIDFDRLAAMGFVTPSSPRSSVADQYRVIKRPLLDNARGRSAAHVLHGNLIMVTSSMPGEGKSFTAVNLALSLAMEVDYTVMLVDADVARPSLMKVLGLPPGPGLLDLLVDDKVEMSQVLLRTNIENLTLLPSGSPRDSATELLASAAMTRLVEDMGKRYPDRIIIFDSPPLLLTTESRVLATHMGQIVMVVQAEKTLQSQVKAALSTIEACPVKLMVLNQARTSGGEAYGYGYGYGHGYGYSHADMASNAQSPSLPAPPSGSGQGG